MLQIPDHPRRVLIIAGSGSGKTNSLFNLLSHKSDIDKIYLYVKDPYEAKYHLLINKQKSTGLKSIFMFLTLLLNSRMIWMIFLKIQKNAILARSIKYQLYLMI